MGLGLGLGLGLGVRVRVRVRVREKCEDEPKDEPRDEPNSAHLLFDWMFRSRDHFSLFIYTLTVAIFYCVNECVLLNF